MIFLAVLFFSRKLSRFFIRVMHVPSLRTTTSLTLILSGLIVIFLLLGGQSILITILLKRFWISLYLAIIIFFLLIQLRKSISFWRNNRALTHELARRNFLLGMVIASQSQLFPLFDQMHFWWGSVPAVVLVILTLKEEFACLHISSKIRHAAISLVLVFLLSVGLIQWSQQIAQVMHPYPNSISQFLYVDPKISYEEKELQAFFLKYIKPRSPVLNLCENANVFFVNNQYKSSSRIFLLWTNILDNKEMVLEMVNSDPSYVVTCSMNRVPSSQQRAEMLQARMLARALPERLLLSTYRQSDNMTWKIWSKG